ncbi:hypothetical protein BDV97DRAFT_404805 [Delphinella strobiligena]|nr:hypothetical protein BDV97DRAFT_404805 [Delphinella strobiligena]
MERQIDVLYRRIVSSSWFIAPAVPRAFSVCQRHHGPVRGTGLPTRDEIQDKTACCPSTSSSRIIHETNPSIQSLGSTSRQPSPIPYLVNDAHDTGCTLRAYYLFASKRRNTLHPSQVTTTQEKDFVSTNPSPPIYIYSPGNLIRQAGVAHHNQRTPCYPGQNP